MSLDKKLQCDTPPPSPKFKIDWKIGKQIFTGK